MDDFIVKAAELADTEEEAFTLGYLAKVASMGHTPVEFDKMLKQGIIGPILGSAAGSLATNIVAPAMAALAVPSYAGDFVGKVVKDELMPGEADVDIVRKEVLIDELNRQAARLRRIAKLSQQSEVRGRSMGI